MKMKDNRNGPNVNTVILEKYFSGKLNIFSYFYGTTTLLSTMMKMKVDQNVKKKVLENILQNIFREIKYFPYF